MACEIEFYFEYNMSLKTLQMQQLPQQNISNI